MSRLSLFRPLFPYFSEINSFLKRLFQVCNFITFLTGIAQIVSLTFTGTTTLQHLQATLEGQPLYVELLQEVSPGHAPGAQTVLATFETSAVEFLFPYPQLRPTYTSGVDVDLLMEPTRDFPGIISPKVSQE